MADTVVLKPASSAGYPRVSSRDPGHFTSFLFPVPRCTRASPNLPARGSCSPNQDGESCIAMPPPGMCSAPPPVAKCCHLPSGRRTDAERDCYEAEGLAGRVRYPWRLVTRDVRLSQPVNYLFSGRVRRNACSSARVLKCFTSRRLLVLHPQSRPAWRPRCRQNQWLGLPPQQFASRNGKVA